MFIVLAIIVGGLYALGLYLLMARSIVQLIFGLVLLSHAANLLIFTAGMPVRGIPPLIREGDVLPPAGYADPVPQALILTAIVISFAVTAFAAVLVKRAYQAIGTDDSDEMTTTER